MRSIGVDLAWGGVRETGVVAMDSDGTVVDAGWTRGVDRTFGWIDQLAVADTMLMIDAPLVVANDSGQRACEREAGQRYGRAWVSANSTNLASQHRAGIELRERLEDAGWTYDDGTSGPPASGRVVSECYPYATIVGAEELGYDDKRPAYKRRPHSITAEAWPSRRASACDALIDRILGLRTATSPMDICTHLVTRRLTDEPSPLTSAAYKHREDLIDACLAAWTAALWVSAGHTRCQVLGGDDSLADLEGRRATIIAPARRLQRRYLPIPIPDCFVWEFELPDGTWMDEVLRMVPEDRTEQPDGSYLFWGGASGHWIRAIAVSPSGVITHDDHGNRLRYRLLALPHPDYPGLNCDRPE
jgi:predicted RNase H-like nuclease